MLSKLKIILKLFKKNIILSNMIKMVRGSKNKKFIYDHKKFQYCSQNESEWKNTEFRISQ